MQEVAKEQKFNKGKRLLGRLGHRWKGNIKMDLRVDIYFGEDGHQRRAALKVWIR
jgi:hypothetical protein